MRLSVVLAALALLLGPSTAPAEVDPAVLAAEDARIAVIQEAKDAVLAIFALDGGGGGSGVVISADGYALTNLHVVWPCGYAMKCGLPDGQLYDTVLVGVDPTGDVALIKLFGRDDFPHARLADSDKVQVGDWCFAMGNPFLLGTDFQPTVTYGIVSGTHRYQYPSGTLLEYTDCIQTDASINPGNSGGPLFDAAGGLIGINGRGSFEKRGRVNVGVAYAVSINQIKNFLGHLRGGSIVDHATLGARVSSDEEGRVVVGDILEQSDAYRRGLRYDDEIVSFGGRPISTPNGFKNVLGIYPKGWRVPLSYRREGRRYDVLVRLGGVHGQEELLEKTTSGPAHPPMPIPKPGEEPKPGDESQPKGPEIPVPGRGDQWPIRASSKVPIPKVISEHFQAKRGYANYYFNRLERDRVWRAWTARADLRDADGPWTLRGKLHGGGDFGLRLSGAGAVLKLPGGEVNWSAGEGLSSSLSPPQSGGLLPALYLWRRLAVEGPEGFGEVHYLGTMPLAGHEGLLDVLVAVHKDIECRFTFDPAGGDLLAMEMFPAEDTDPCEIYFFDYRELGGRFLPGRMEVRVGDDLYATFELEAFSFERGRGD